MSPSLNGRTLIFRSQTVTLRLSWKEKPEPKPSGGCLFSTKSKIGPFFAKFGRNGIHSAAKRRIPVDFY